MTRAVFGRQVVHYDPAPAGTPLPAATGSLRGHSDLLGLLGLAVSSASVPEGTP